VCLREHVCLPRINPFVRSLSQAEIERMGEYHYALYLIANDDFKRWAPEEERAFRDEVAAKDEPGWIEPGQRYGLSRGQMADQRATMARVLPEAEAALARDDIGYVAFHIEQVPEAFHFHLDRDCDAYARLGLEILRQRVLVLRAIDQRSEGEPLRTPKLPVVAPRAAAVTGDTITAAFAGWQKARSPAPGTLAEYGWAIKLFVELHGDMPISGIKRRHARQFVEGLQDAEGVRSGKGLGQCSGTPVGKHRSAGHAVFNRTAPPQSPLCGRHERGKQLPMPAVVAAMNPVRRNYVDQYQ
jgi:hypothetical protein